MTIYEFICPCGEIRVDAPSIFIAEVAVKENGWDAKTTPAKCRKCNEKKSDDQDR